mgnify:CR=1 FL=1
MTAVPDEDDDQDPDQSPENLICIRPARPAQPRPDLTLEKN